MIADHSHISLLQNIFWTTVKEFSNLCKLSEWYSMCLPVTKQRIAGSEIFTAFQIRKRFKVKIQNSDLDTF